MSIASDQLEEFYAFAARMRDSNPETFTLEDALQEFLLQRNWQPRTELGRKLKQRREEFIAQGGKLLTDSEVQQEVRERRGGLADSSNQLD